jgi:hypothetical protein
LDGFGQWTRVVVASRDMPHFLLTFGDVRRPPVGTVIIEAPSMFQAGVTAVVRRLAPGVPFGEGPKLSAENDDGNTAGRDRQDDVRCGSGGTDPSSRPGSRKATATMAVNFAGRRR